MQDELSHNKIWPTFMLIIMLSIFFIGMPMYFLQNIPMIQISQESNIPKSLLEYLKKESYECSNQQLMCIKCTEFI